MPSKTGIPSVGRDRRLGSGFLLSTPGRTSQTTTPHSLLPQSTILMRAYCLETSHTPVGLGERDAAVCDQAGAGLHATRISTTAVAAQSRNLFPVVGFIRFGTRRAT